MIKLYAWESPFASRIDAVRGEEIGLYKKNGVVLSLTYLVVPLAPTIIVLGVFGLYSQLHPHDILKPETVFVCITLFDMMSRPGLVGFPWAITQMAKVLVSIRRIQDFLNGEEMSETAVKNRTTENASLAVELKKATLRWNEGGFELRDLNLTVERGSLTAVVGIVGSGKSSLISAILGEMELVSGEVALEGSVAYVAQQAWIRNETVRDNILFQSRYNQRNGALIKVTKSFFILIYV